MNPHPLVAGGTVRQLGAMVNEVHIVAYPGKYGPLYALVGPYTGTEIRMMVRPVPRLTDREQQVLALIGRGMEADEIAAELGVSRRVAQHYISSVLQLLVGHLLPPDAAAELALTRREVDVLRCLERGLSDRQIAEDLRISIRTAEDHVRTVLRKTHGSSRLDVLSEVTRQERRFTAREREVIGLIDQGLTSKQIAETLGISTRTVSDHIYQAMRKSGVRSRRDLGRYLANPHRGDLMFRRR